MLSIRKANFKGITHKTWLLLPKSLFYIWSFNITYIVWARAIARWGAEGPLPLLLPLSLFFSPKSPENEQIYTRNYQLYQNLRQEGPGFRTSVHPLSFEKGAFLGLAPSLWKLPMKLNQPITESLDSVADPGFLVGGVDSRGGYVSKILYAKTKESWPLGGRAPGIRQWDCSSFKAGAYSSVLDCVRSLWLQWKTEWHNRNVISSKQNLDLTVT